MNQQLICSAQVDSTCEGHTEIVVSIIYFPKPNDIVVSCSHDGSVRCWDGSSERCLKVINLKKEVNHLVKWDDHSFLCCCSNCQIYCYSIRSSYECLKIFNVNKSPVIRLLKLDSRSFISLNEKGELFVIDYETCEVKTKLNSEEVDSNARLTLSEVYPNSFYVNTVDKNRSVKLIDYKENKVLKVFSKDNDKILTTSVFLNEEEEEILIAGDNEGVMYVFNTQTGTMIKRVKVTNWITSSVCVNNRYLAVADSEGFIHLYDSLNSYKKVHEIKIHEDYLFDITSIFNRNIYGNSFIKFLTCSGDSTIRMSSFSLNPEDDEQFFPEEDWKTVFDNQGKIFDEFFDNDPSNPYFSVCDRHRNELSQLAIDMNLRGCEIMKRVVFQILFRNEISYQEIEGFVSQTIRSKPEYFEVRYYEVKKPKKGFYFGYQGRDKRPSRGYAVEMKKKGRSKYSPIYIGEFREGFWEGRGSLYNPKNRKKFFEGEFRKGKKNGKGVEYFAQKDGFLRLMFEGLYENDKRHGRGESYESKTGTYTKGVWVEGKLDKESVFKFECPIISYNAIQKHAKDSTIVGQGAFGVVYRVKASLVQNVVKTEDEFVAVKVMKCSSRLDREFLFRSIKRGVELTSRIQHPENEHILHTYGIFKGIMEIGYIMAYGKISIDKVISSSGGSLSIDEKIRFLFETAKGMKGLHSQRVMHRDLKWGNILLDANNCIKLTDFDTLKEDSRDWKLKLAAMTQNLGTPGYCAPEVLKGMKYGLECDVFAFGIMIYSLLYELNQPYLSQFQCTCGKDIRNIISTNSLGFHVYSCNLRPLLDPKKLQKYPSHIIDLMIMCWDDDPLKRPTFPEIVEIFDSGKKREKCYSIVNFTFKKHDDEQHHGDLFKKTQKMLLVHPEREKIVDWLENKFAGSKVIRLTHHVLGDLRTNEEVKKMIYKEDRPTVDVELEISEVLTGKAGGDEEEETEGEGGGGDRKGEGGQKGRPGVVERLMRENTILREQIMIMREENQRLMRENFQLTNQGGGGGGMVQKEEEEEEKKESSKKSKKKKKKKGKK